MKTDILLEQVHQLNENLIAEINDYEAKCVESFNQESVIVYKKEIGQLLTEINYFYKETTKYLTEFKIERKKIEGDPVLVNTYQDKLNKEASMLRNIKFGGKLFELKKSENKHGKSLLDFLLNDEVGFGLEVHVSERVLQNCSPIRQVISPPRGRGGTLIYSFLVIL